MTVQEITKVMKELGYKVNCKGTFPGCFHTWYTGTNWKGVRKRFTALGCTHHKEYTGEQMRHKEFTLDRQKVDAFRTQEYVCLTKFKKNKLGALEKEWY